MRYIENNAAAYERYPLCILMSRAKPYTNKFGPSTAEL